MSAASHRPRKAYRTEWVERWCPPKPLVGISVIERVLNRHTALDCPESRLVVAVIAHAIHECLSPNNRRRRREARRFVLGEALTLWCDLVGLHPDFVRLIARKAGYLPDERAHWQRVPMRVPIEPGADSAASPTQATPVGKRCPSVPATACHAAGCSPEGGVIDTGAIHA